MAFDVLPLILALVLGYLCGSVPFGLILTGAAGLGDIRAIGSGNIGATNVLRTGNRSLAAATLVLDALKAAVAILVARYFWGDDAAMLAAVGAFFGHCFPVWLGFKGGKGVAVMIGSLLSLSFPVGLVFCAVWLLIGFTRKISSLAALTAAATAPIFTYVFNSNVWLTVTVAALALLLFYQHRENIGRLLKGTEPTIGGSKKSGLMPMGDPSGVLTPAQRVAWLRLVRSNNIGPVTFRQLLSRFGLAEEAIAALPDLGKKVGRVTTIISQARAEDEIAGLSRFGAKLVAQGEPDYPPHLYHIPAAPPLITMAGGERLDWQRTVGIVGARNASTAGIKMTRMLASDLGERGYTVVSGLARGIDTAAHRASISSGTIAVLAGGFDRIYPDENIPLAHDILDNGGALLTEMPLGWEPRARDFPRRNRLVSGLSLGIVVVEAAKRSGSLITARLALEQNREVFAVPGSPLDPRAEGGNALIQQGAKLITNAEDIIEVLGSADPARMALLDVEWRPEDIGGAPPAEDDLSRLMEALSTTPVEVDELIAATGIGPSAMQMLLLELDLAGKIEWSSGQLVALRFE